MNTTTMGVAMACATAALATPATAQNAVVSPVDRARLEGSVSTSYPLGRWNARVQQLHADLGASPRSFAGHAYRRDAISLHGAVAAYKVEMSVALSMSPTTPATASSAFANNAGTPVAVLPRTWVSFPATTRPNQAPAAAFDLRVPYGVSFPYPGAGTVCIDTTVFGNDGPNGINANFTAYLDAHEQHPNGRTAQPGYRYGQGCAPLSGGAAATASFELRWLTTGMEFEIQARNGVPTDSTGPGMSALITGLQQRNQPFSLRPACQQLVSPDNIWALSGANTSQGHWNGVLQGFTPLPVGLVFHAQIVSGHMTGGLALSDASTIEVPPFGPVPPATARIAHGSDGTSPTGTVSPVVPVLELF